MTDSEKISEWERFVLASQPDYRYRAIQAVYKNDGQRILEGVLKKLNIRSVVDLVKMEER